MKSFIISPYPLLIVWGQKQEGPTEDKNTVQYKKVIKIILSYSATVRVICAFFLFFFIDRLQDKVYPYVAVNARW